MSRVMHEVSHLTYRVVAMNVTDPVEEMPKTLRTREAADSAARILARRMVSVGKTITHVSIRSVRQVQPIVNEVAKVLA